MNGHTPGPWFIYDEKATDGLPIAAPGIDSESVSIILYGTESDECGVNGRTPEEQMANARLIAAAPDLLDACNVAFGHLTGGMDGDWRDCDPVKLLRNAIAKAMPPDQEGGKQS